MSSSEEEHVCMEWACVKDWSDDPPLGKFRVLWAGHYDKVSQGQQIFVSNVRFTFVARRQHLGLGIPFVLYQNQEGRWPNLGILLHEHGRPSLVVSHSVHAREDDMVRAICWTFAATGAFIHAKFLWASVPWKKPSI